MILGQTVVVCLFSWFKGPIIRDRAFSTSRGGFRRYLAFSCANRIRPVARSAFSVVLVFSWFVSFTGLAQQDVGLLVPGEVHEVRLLKGVDSRWMGITPNFERGIVWFFAEPLRPDSVAALRIRTTRGVSGSPAWVRSQTNGPAPEALISTDSEGGSVPIKIWAEAEPEFDAHEPNDAFQEAAPLAAGGNRFFLYPQADQDWFSFTIPQASEYRAAVTIARGGSVFRDGLELGISDQGQRPLVQRVGQLDDGGIWQTVPFDLKAGEYRCWVRARGSRFSRFPLVLTLERADGDRSIPAVSPAVALAGSTRASGSIPDPLAVRSVKGPARSPVGARVLLGLLLGMIVWWGAALLRPRRVFDLTR